MSNDKRTGPMPLAEAAETAIKLFSIMYYEDSDGDGVPTMEVVEDLIRGIREWSMTADGDGWDDMDLLIMARSISQS